MKQLLIIAAAVFMLTTTAHASWMGETWLYVRFDRAGDYRSDLKGKQSTFTVLKWAVGGGHGTTYGKRMVGKTYTKIISFNKHRDVNKISPGHKAWIYHRASNNFYYDRNAKKTKNHSASTWKYLGTSIKRKLKKIAPDSQIQDTQVKQGVSVKWYIKKDSFLSMKVAYKTFGNYNPKFTLYKIKSTSDTITLYLVYKMTYKSHSYTNRKKIDTYFLHYDISQYNGKKIIITSGNKQILSI